MSVWPKSFLDPNSDRWRRKVEGDVDAATGTVSGFQTNLRSLASAITGLRERVAAQFGNFQSGTTAIQGDGTTGIITDVVFPVPYAVPPAVVVSYAGYRVGYTADVSGASYASLETQGHVAVVNVTTDGFSLVLLSSSAVYSAANYYYATWMARAVG